MTLDHKPCMCGCTENQAQLDTNKQVLNMQAN